MSSDDDFYFDSQSDYEYEVGLNDLDGFFSSLGKAVKKVGKIAAPIAAGMIPGVGTFIAPALDAALNSGGGGGGKGGGGQIEAAAAAASAQLDALLAKVQAGGVSAAENHLALRAVLDQFGALHPSKKEGALHASLNQQLTQKAVALEAAGGEAEKRAAAEAEKKAAAEAEPKASAAVALKGGIANVLSGGGNELIPGVSNQTLMIGGAVVGVVFLMLIISKK